jgi:dihydrofolate reductase
MPDAVARQAASRQRAAAPPEAGRRRGGALGSRRGPPPLLGVRRHEPRRVQRVAVLAHAPREARHGETFHAGDAAVILDAILAEGARHVYADGGSVISQLLAADRVDELTLSIVPVVLGGGLRLFQGPLPERRLALESARSYPTGLVQLRYLARP